MVKNMKRCTFNKNYPFCDNPFYMNDNELFDTAYTALCVLLLRTVNDCETHKDISDILDKMLQTKYNKE